MRGSAASRGYGSRWRKARTAYLAAHPLCVCCQANGRIEPAVLVDHAVPHRGDKALFWRREWWQGLCEWCDRHVKQVVEDRWSKGEAVEADLFLARPCDLWRPPAGR